MTVYVKDLSFGCHGLFLQSKWRPVLLCLLWPWHHPLCHPVYLWSSQGKEPTLWMGLLRTVTGLFDEVLIFEFLLCHYFLIVLNPQLGWAAATPAAPSVWDAATKKGCWDRWFTCQLGYFVLQLVVALWQDGQGQPADTMAFDPRLHLFSPVTIGWKLCLAQYKDMIPLWLLSFVKFPFSLNQPLLLSVLFHPVLRALPCFDDPRTFCFELCFAGFVIVFFCFCFFSSDSGAKAGCQQYTYV